ncbi:MAG: tetratricopeptide repeat protein, partial [Candidatus Krumholzibacteria bacterium]|nr:tetratricopeptide repeat protein [Candidatus Krumholzibacteria bacterium]
YAQNALDWLGDCYLRQSQYQNAHAVYQEFLRINPNDVRAITGMARVLAATGNPQEAERTLLSIVDPTTAGSPQAYIALAEVQRDLGKTREAIENYKIVSKFMGYQKDGLVALAELYQESGDIDAAIQALQEAANYFPPGDVTVRKWIQQLRSMK